MILQNCYGRSLATWLLYKKLLCRFGSRLYIIDLNEVNVRPVPFWWSSTAPNLVRG